MWQNDMRFIWYNLNTPTWWSSVNIISLPLTPSWSRGLFYCTWWASKLWFCGTLFLRMDSTFSISCYVPWASYQIRKIVGCACAGNAGKVFPTHRLQRKPLVSDPGMHHGTCVTHVPWCMSGSLTCGGGENVPGIPGACAAAILRIWQEAHVRKLIASPHNRWGDAI